MEFAYLPEIFRPPRATIEDFKNYKSLVYSRPNLAETTRATNVVASSVVCRMPDYFQLVEAEKDLLAILQSLIRKIGQLSIKEILATHCLIMGASRSRFRKSAVVVGMTTSQPMGFLAAEYEIKSEIEWLIDACVSIENDSSMFAFFLFFFLHVHPFSDGNGRISRVALLGISDKRGGEAASKAMVLLAYIEQHKLDFVKAMYVARISSPDRLIIFVEQALVANFDASAT